MAEILAAVTAGASLLQVMKRCRDECKLAKEFPNELSTFAKHLESMEQVLFDSSGKVRADLNLETSQKELLNEYKKHLDAVVNLVTTFGSKSGPMKAFSRKDAARKLHNAITAARDIESKLTLASSMRVSKDLADAVTLNKQIAEMLTQLQVASDGGFMTMFNDRATDLEREGTNSKWLQTSSDFQNLVKSVRDQAERNKSDSFRQGLAPVQDIELIKNQTMMALTEVEKLLDALPKEFQSQEKDLIEHLAEHRSRVESLGLTVAFIGPAKSGKSTTINALLGVPLSPSHTFPCTVIPTILRHTKGQKLPRLLIKESFKEGMEKAIAEIHAKATEIERHCGLTEPEKKYMQLITTGNYSFPSLLCEEYQKIEVLQDKLAFMNSLCRIYARAKKTRLPDASEFLVERESPLVSIINDRAWPVIELEVEQLRDERIAGVFEIVDTPGRDETTLIPEIKGAVNAVMEDSAAVVCVINIQTAMTDGMMDIRNELKAALRFEQPVLLLANKVDALEKNAKKNLALLENDIGQAFLTPVGENYDCNNERRVFGVSASLALEVSLASRMEFLNPKLCWRAITALPDSVDEEGCLLDDIAIDGLSSRDLNSLVNVFEKEHGNAWPKTIKKSIDKNMYELSDFKSDLANVKKMSKFGEFNNKLLKGMAPKAGQKVLADHIKPVRRSISNIISKMDLYVDLALGTENEFRDKQVKLENMLKILKQSADKKIPEVMNHFLKMAAQQAKDASEVLAHELTQQVMEKKVDLQKNGLPGFLLSDTPSEAELKNHPYLQCMVGKGRFWETPLRQAEDLQETLRSTMQAVTDKGLEAWITKKEKAARAFNEEIVTALLDAVKNDASDCLNISALKIDKTDIKLKKLRVRLPDEEMGTTKVKKEKRKKWYTLWMIPVNVKVGQSFLLPVSKAGTIFVEAAHMTAEEAASALRDEQATCIREMADSVKKAFEQKCKDVQKQLDEVVKEREKRKTNGTYANMLQVAKSRIVCEGLDMTLSDLHDQAEGAGDLSSLKIPEQIDLDKVQDEPKFIVQYDDEMAVCPIEVIEVSTLVEGIEDCNRALCNGGLGEKYGCIGEKSGCILM